MVSESTFEQRSFHGRVFNFKLNLSSMFSDVFNNFSERSENVKISGKKISQILFVCPGKNGGMGVPNKRQDNLIAFEKKTRRPLSTGIFSAIFTFTN